MERADVRPFAERTPAACERCGGATFTRVSQWRGQWVRGGTILGLEVRCDGCGLLWVAKIPLVDLAIDEPLVWSPGEPLGESW